MELQKLPITLIMIVRNSAGRLKEVIQAHRDVVSEVVVIDQSSDDGTYEEALAHADFVIKRRNKGKCEGDRNFAFEIGNQPWVLNLDDDEFLSDETKTKLADSIDRGADIVWLKRRNIVDGVDCADLMGDDPQCRLFKRGAVTWLDETHHYAQQTPGTIAFYPDDMEILHKRTFAGIKATHDRRSKVLEPKMLELERNFVSSLEAFLKKKEAENGTKP